MRENKYRVWNGKIMGKPFTLDDAAYEGFPRPVTDDNGECDLKAKLIWLQYTGLKDKNKVEIYEGDIVKGDSNNYFIKYLKGAPSLVNVKNINKDDNETTGFFLGACQNQYRVIGNIYENPNLIKE